MSEQSSYFGIAKQLLDSKWVRELVCEYDSDNKTLESILTKFCTTILWRKISVEFVNERNRFKLFKSWMILKLISI